MIAKLFVLSIANFCGIFFLLAIDATSLAFAETTFAIAYTSARGNGQSESGSLESTESVGTNVNLRNGIYRGEAHRPEPDDQPPVEGRSAGDDMNSSKGIEGTTTSTEEGEDEEEEDKLSWPEGLPEAAGGDANTIDYSGLRSCDEDTEDLLSMNADIRMELSAIDLQYLENASIENVCNRDGKFSSCDFDFGLYQSNLQMVCKNHGGNFYSTEHSIQCQNQITMEKLYYQFDHFPSCFAAACEEMDAKRLLTERINSITQTMSEYLDTPCFADDDILRHANDASLVESPGSIRSRQWVNVFAIAPFLLFHWM
jgi:hypothetical protein